jgi:hypothetical protein
MFRLKSKQTSTNLPELKKKPEKNYLTGAFQDKELVSFGIFVLISLRIIKHLYCILNIFTRRKYQPISI